MAGKKYYAWSQIKYYDRANGKYKVVPCGNEVSKTTLKVDDAQWGELVDTKAVRQVPYPVPPSLNPLSPVQFYKQQAKVLEDDLTESMIAATMPVEDEDEAAVAQQPASAA